MLHRLGPLMLPLLAVAAFSPTVATAATGADLSSGWVALAQVLSMLAAAAGGPTALCQFVARGPVVSIEFRVGGRVASFRLVDVEDEPADVIRVGGR